MPPAPGSSKPRTEARAGKKLTQGLPAVKLGRIGLDWYRKDPNLVYAVIDSEKAGTTTAAYLGVAGEKGRRSKEAKVTQLAEEGPRRQGGHQAWRCRHAPRRPAGEESR